MTEEAEKRMQERIEALAAQVESLRAQLSAMPSSDAPDANDFGGGGEPDWSGAMGRVPDGFIENPAIPPLPDTTAAKDPGRLNYKSLDDRGQDNAPPGVTQIHDFDEEMTLARKVMLAANTVSGTGGGQFLELQDPDGNWDPSTKWMIPLRNASTGGREIQWAAFGGRVTLPVGPTGPTGATGATGATGGIGETDTEQNPGNPPGESIDHYGGANGPIELRGFQTDAAKGIEPVGGQGSGTPLANAEIVFRDTTGRKRVEYANVSNGPFWVQGADESVNFGTGLKLGSAAIGYVTITVTA